MSKIFWLRSVCICLDGCPSGKHTHVSILPQTPVQAAAWHRAESPVLHSRSLLVLHFKFSSVYKSIPNSLTISSHHPSLLAAISSLSKSESLFLFCISPSLSGFLHSRWQSLGPSVLLQTTLPWVPPAFFVPTLIHLPRPAMLPLAFLAQSGKRQSIASLTFTSWSVKPYAHFHLCSRTNWVTSVVLVF